MEERINELEKRLTDLENENKRLARIVSLQRNKWIDDIEGYFDTMFDVIVDKIKEEDDF